MKLSVAELASVRVLGLYLTEKCDACGKASNQTFRYTISGRSEVFCSALCRDNAFFDDRREALKHSTPGMCAYCRANLEGKRRGALYCDEICKKRAAGTDSTAEPKITGTPAQSNQRFRDRKNTG